MANVQESNYISICKISFNNTGEFNEDTIDTDRNSEIGKILKKAFRMLPSKSVISEGKVTCSIDGTFEDDNENDESNENYNYHIYEAYCNMKSALKVTNEINNTAIINKFVSSISSSNNADDTEVGGSDKDDKESDNSNDTDKESDDTDKDDDNEFEPGDIVTVKVKLKNEGYTLWNIVIDKRADTNRVIAALNAKKFNQAYKESLNGNKSDGIVVVSVETFIYKNAKCGIPYFGNCRYGFDAGNTDGGPEGEFNISLAVAPINMKLLKPTKNTVYKVTYNVVGDITDGKLGELVEYLKDIVTAAIPALSVTNNTSKKPDSKEAASISDKLSKFLHSKFKCVGDASMYREFKRIRDFLEKQVKEGNLILATGEDETDTPIKYAKSPDVKKSIIAY